MVLDVVGGDNPEYEAFEVEDEPAYYVQTVIERDGDVWVTLHEFSVMLADKPEIVRTFPAYTVLT